MNGKRQTIIVPRDKPEFRKAFILMFLIDSYFEAVFLQRERVESERNKEISEINFGKLFADIHFLLVSSTNLLYALKSLKSLLKEDEELAIIYKKYDYDLEYLSKFRGHLEHITDKRLEGLGKDGQPLKEPNALGDLWGDEYDFGGERFNLPSSFSMFEKLLGELKRWNAETLIYPLWNT